VRALGYEYRSNLLPPVHVRSFRKTGSHLKKIGPACLAAIVLVTPLRAADVQTPPASADNWVVSVGGMGTFSPDYPGSSKFSPGFMPSLSWHKEGETSSFSAPEDGVDVSAYQSGPFAFGATFGFDAGRYSRNDARLKGLNTVRWTIEPGIFAEYWPLANRFRTRMEVLHGMHKTDGLIVNLSADWVAKYGQFTLSGGPRVTFADRMQMKSRFGVSPVEALASGSFAPYAPRGGGQSVGFGLAQSYDISKSWTGTLYQHYDHYVGPAANSPLVVTGGSRNQYTVGAGLVYSFKMGW